MKQTDIKIFPSEWEQNMGNGTPSESYIKSKLEDIKRQLAEVGEQVQLCQLMADPAPPAASQTADSAAVLEDLVVAVRETSEQIVARLDARDLQLARVRDLEERLRSVEEAVEEQADKERLLWREDMKARMDAFRQSAQTTSTANASSRLSPADYMPVISSAIQMVRDIALRILERQQAQPEKPSPARKP